MGGVRDEYFNLVKAFIGAQHIKNWIFYFNENYGTYGPLYKNHITGFLGEIYKNDRRWAMGDFLPSLSWL